MSNVKIISGFNHLDEVAKLFDEYKQELNVDISFQPVDETEEEIAKRYSEPLGKIFIALVDGQAAGVIAFHPMEDKNYCEFKRLFVRLQFRGLHVGNILMEHAINEAKSIGYHRIYLDTLSTLKPACHMYERFGFEQIDAYYYNPLPDVIYYRLNLEKANKK